MGRQLKLNLANLLTLFRIAAIPVVVICFYSPLPYARPLAAILFGIAAVTDIIDGWVARRFGQTSRFGEFLDPVADKLMVCIVLVMLVQAEAKWFEDVIAMIIIGREITVSALREWMATIGERANVKVSVAGKVKTTLQMFGIALMVYQHPILLPTPAGVQARSLHLVAPSFGLSSSPCHRTEPVSS